MLRKISVLLCACVVVSSFPSFGFSTELFGKAPEGSVSIFDYGVDGMGLGLGGGISAGFIRYENEDDKGTEILVSGAYGLLVGAGLGLAMGAVDASNGKKGIGALVLRDMKMGGNFGSIIGLIAGGIKSMNKNDSRYLGDSISWGYLGGALAGVGVAFIENQKPPSKMSSNPNFNNSVVFMQDSKNNSYPAYAASYRF